MQEYLRKGSSGLNKETGIIHAYDAFKGYGFIRREKGKDVFFFYDQLSNEDYEPTMGDLVDFDVVTAPKGPKAINVQKIGHVELL